MGYRDRSAGWQHAKLSGHKNEELVKNELDNNPEFAKSFLYRTGLINDQISHIILI